MKQIEKTPDIVSKLRRAVGPDVDLEDLAVYESISLNSLPLRKQHPILNKAVVENATLVAMADAVNRESIPLHIYHDSWSLNIGRVFYGEVMKGKGGKDELRTLMFLSKSAKPVEVQLIDSGTVDQVSAGFVGSHAFCSKCNFDFQGPDSTWEQLYSGTCPDGHKMGQGGAHAKIVGLESWFELSLVPTGGAQNARIQSPSTALLDNRMFQLADGPVPASSLVIRASATKESPGVDINLDEFMTRLVAGETKVAQLTATNEALTAQVTELTEKVKAVDGVDVAGLQTKLSEAEAKVEKADALVLSMGAKIATLARVDAPKNVGDVEEFVEKTTITLADIVKKGGTSESATSGKGAKVERTNLAAYVVRNK